MLLEVNAYLFTFFIFFYLLICLFIYLFTYLFFCFKSGLTGFKMQRACKLTMLVLIVYSGCGNEIDLQTLIL